MLSDTVILPHISSKNNIILKIFTPGHQRSFIALELMTDTKDVDVNDPSLILFCVILSGKNYHF